MLNIRAIFRFVAVLLPFYLAVFGRPMPEDVSLETVVVANMEISAEGVGEDGGEKIDDGWIFIGEEDVNSDGKVMDNMEGVLMGPTYVLVPSKGDIATVPPPNTTTPGPEHSYPLFRPIKSPDGGFLGGFLSFLVAVVYLLLSLGICIAICILMIICTCMFEQWRVPVPHNAPPVQQINVIPPPLAITRARETGRSHSQVRSKIQIRVVRAVVNLADQQRM